MISAQKSLLSLYKLSVALCVIKIKSMVQTHKSIPCNSLVYSFPLTISIGRIENDLIYNFFFFPQKKEPLLQQLTHLLLQEPLLHFSKSHIVSGLEK